MRWRLRYHSAAVDKTTTVSRVLTCTLTPNVTDNDNNKALRAIFIRSSLLKSDIGKCKNFCHRVILLLHSQLYSQSRNIWIAISRDLNRFGIFYDHRKIQHELPFHLTPNSGF